MTTYDELLRAARALTPVERLRLVRDLGGPAAGARAAELPIANVAAPRPHSAAWVKAERGHAVLSTDAAEAEAHIPSGPAAIAGMWADRPEMGDGAAWMRTRSGRGSA